MNKHAVLRRVLPAIVVAGLMAVTGCDWSSGGGVNDFNTRIASTQVSGTYRGVNAGDPIITDFTSEASATRTNVTTGTSSGEKIAEGNGFSTAFAGTFDNDTVIAGSVLITVPPGYTFTDDGAGSLTGVPSGSGSISYSTGAWSIDLGGVAPAVGADILASYSYNGESVVAGDELRSGASRTTIYTFTIQQSGNTFSMTDNNGDSYQGRVSSSEVVSQSSITEASAADSDASQDIETVVQFSATGNSQGVPVELIGSFNIGETVFFAEQLNATTTELTFEFVELYRVINISMDGIWIEENGSTGNIRAFGPQNQRIETTDLSLF